MIHNIQWLQNVDSETSWKPMLIRLQIQTYQLVSIMSIY